MCGIVGYVGNKRVVPVIIDGLKRLEYRGYDSAGIAVSGNGEGLHIRRAEGKLRNLEEVIRLKPLDGTYGIGHTRAATHGRPTEENAHPHRDCTGRVVVVHNGIIENYVTLKKKLIEEGHKFTTETDTEVIAHLVEKYFFKSTNGHHPSLEEAVRKTVGQLSGVFALAVIAVDEPNKIVAARNGPPAVIGLLYRRGGGERGGELGKREEKHRRSRGNRRACGGGGIVYDGARGAVSGRGGPPQRMALSLSVSPPPYAPPPPPPGGQTRR